MLRLYTERRLDFRRAFHGIGAIQTVLFRLQRDSHWTETYIRRYESQKETLSFRGSVEYAILLRGGGYTNAARQVLENVATNTATLGKAVDKGVTRWVRGYPVLTQYLPSNHRQWQSAAATLLSLCGTNANDSDVMLGTRVREMQSLLGQRWEFPWVKQLIASKLGPAGAEHRASMEDGETQAQWRSRWGIVQVMWWLTVVIAAVVVLCNVRGSIGAGQQSNWAFRYFRNWSDLPLLSLWIRAGAYRWLWEFICASVCFVILPYWPAYAGCGALVTIFPAGYAIARVMPSRSVVKQSFGLNPRSHRRALIAVASCLWLTYIVFELATQTWQMQGGTGSEQLLPRELVLNPSLVAIIGTVLVWSILVPISEEIFFRGFLYAALRARYGVGIGMIVSAAAFALVHPYGWRGLVVIFADGLLFAYGFEKTGSLLPGMTVHGLILFFSALNTLILYNPAF
jgi:membrane protease YdiL (CAAX protease family)